MDIRNPNNGKYIPDTAHNRSVIRSGQFHNPNPHNGYYQSQDSYVGSSPQAPLLTKMVLYIVGYGLLYEALKMISPYLANSANYSYPYKPIAMFYDYTIAVPFQSIDKVWYWLVSLEWPWLISLELGTSESVSFLVACVGIAIYTYVLVVLYRMWINTVAKIFRHPATNGPSRAAAWLIFILPALFALIWYIIPVTWHFIIELINYSQAK